jgi:beta-glucosidase
MAYVNYLPSVNEQETNRIAATPPGCFNSVVDDRTMHEAYLWPWVDGVSQDLGPLCVH